MPMRLLGVLSGFTLTALLSTSASVGFAATIPTRPQEQAISASPAPYRSENVTFNNAARSGVDLAGTMTVPQGQGPFPALVLVAGSGPQTRDEIVEDHAILRVLADHLTRRGYAVLRYDKRGVGESTGDYALATTMDFASDAGAAITFLRGRRDIAPGAIGVIGHSEGGIIAPMLAASDRKLAFIVLLAGPAVRPALMFAEQERLLWIASGMPAGETAKNYSMLRKMCEAVGSSPDARTAEVRVREIAAASPDANRTEADLDGLVKFLTQPWTLFSMGYDPSLVLKRVHAPVLALNGAKDTQVPAAMNIPALRAGFSHSKDLKVIELPGLNHLFQQANTGAPAEYGAIEQTLDPSLFAVLDPWLDAHTRSSPGR